jgi:hypothetical protein
LLAILITLVARNANDRTGFVQLANALKNVDCAHHVDIKRLAGRLVASANHRLSCEMEHHIGVGLSHRRVELRLVTNVLFMVVVKNVADTAYVKIAGVCWRL